MVKRAGENRAHTAFSRAVLSQAAAAVIPFCFHDTVHLFEKLGRVLKIRVHKNAVVAGSVLKSRVHCGLFTKIP